MGEEDKADQKRKKSPPQKKKEKKKKGGRTTSGNGQAGSSPSPKGQWRTQKNERDWL